MTTLNCRGLFYFILYHLNVSMTYYILFNLGYIVCSGARRSFGAQGIRILVQSDKQPSYVDGKIEAFIQYFDVSF